MKKIIKKIRLRTWISLSLIFIVLPVIAFVLYYPQNTSAQWYDDFWSYRKKLTIDKDQVEGGGDIRNFPVLVSLTSDAGLSANAQADGDDILFTDEYNQKLVHEIESYSSGTLIAWVKLPILYSNKDTEIYMYYGNATVSSQENTTAVWEDYAVVQHLEETTTGATDFTDSTANGNNSVAVTIDGTGSNPDATGKIGSAVQFDGVNDYISLGSDASLDNIANGSMCAWVYPDDTAVGTEWYFSKDDAGFNDGDIHLRLETTIRGMSTLSGAEEDAISNSSYTPANWYYTCYSFGDGLDGTLNINGIDQTDTSTIQYGMQNATANLILGALRAGNGEFDGILDEVTVSTTRRDGSWHKTSYNNQNSPSTFFSLASQESNPNPGPVAYWAFDEGVNNSCAGGTNDACDSTSQGNDGLFSGTPTWRNEELCISGKCVYFNATTSDYIDVGSGSIIGGANATEDFTIAAWAKSFTDGRYIYSQGNTGNSNVLFEMVVGGANTGLTFNMRNSSGTLYQVDEGSGSPDRADGNWHHFAVTRNGSTVTLYVDGQNVHSETISPSGTFTANDATIGKRFSDANEFEGFLDEVKLYNYARSADQIKADFIARGSSKGSSAQFGSAKSYLSEGLLGYWNLENVNDISGSKYNLTNNGTTTFSAGKFGDGSEHVAASSQYLSYGSTISGVRTVSFWVNPNSDTNNFFQLSGSDYMTSSTGTITLTGFGTNEKLYINGVESTTIAANSWQLVTIVTESAISTTALQIGRANGTHFDGTMDEFRLYNRPLSPIEIQRLYNWAPGPIGYWPMDEGSGTTSIFDRSGNGYNADLVSMTRDSWVTGKYGSSLDFDGTADYVDTNQNFSFSSTDSFTVSAWIRTTQTGSNGATAKLVNKGPGFVNTWGLQYRFDATYGAHALFGVQGSSGSDNAFNDTATGIPINDGKWHYLTGIYDGTTGYVYVYTDGVFQAVDNTVNSTGDFNRSADVFFGARSVSLADYFDGSIDEVKIYNYIRTPDQLLEDMNASHPLGGSPVGSQVAYWKMDEGYGTDTNNSTSLSFAETITGALWNTQQNCKINNCLNFDGTDDVLTITNNAAIDLNDGLQNGLTFSAWVNPDSAGEGSAGEIFRKSATTYCRLSGSSPFTLDCSLDLATDATASIASVIPTGTWTHVAMSYTDDEDDEITIWINGIPKVTSTNGVGPASAESSNLLIGGGTSNNWDGKIDEFKIYSSELLRSEMLIDMNANASINFGSGYSETDDLTDTYTPPVAYYTFDENTGTSTTNDYSENSYTGTLTSITENSWVPGKSGSALNLDGTSDYVDIGTGPTDVNSVSFWVYPETTTEYFINLTSTTDYISASSGTISATGFTSPTIYVNGRVSSTLVAGQWQHVVVTSATSENASNFDIGRTQDTNYLQGKIDEVKLWSNVLTVGQVAYEYNRGKPLVHWKFDECQGTLINDSSQSSFNATLTVGGSGTNTSPGTCSGSSGQAWNDGAEGKLNYGLEFDGTDDYVISNDNIAYGSAFSYTAWIKPTDLTGTEMVIVKKSTTTLESVQFYISNDDITARVYSADNVWIGRSSNNLLTTNWQHLAMTYNGGTTNAAVRIYINGKQVDDSNSSSGSFSSFNNLGIPTTVGVQNINDVPSNYFAGQIDDVRIYSYPLSESQVQKVMLGGDAGSAVRFGPETGTP